MPLKFRPTPAREVLMEALRYDPTTGALAWPNGRFAGCKQRTRIMVGINGDMFVAHRLIWKMMTGFDPAGDLDHINGDPLDNRWSNLREATRVENCRNRKVRHGHQGAVETRGRYQAKISIDGKQSHIGMFSTKEEAHEAYRAKAREVFGEFYRAA